MHEGREELGAEKGGGGSAAADIDEDEAEGRLPPRFATTQLKLAPFVVVVVVVLEPLFETLFQLFRSFRRFSSQLRLAWT